MSNQETTTHQLAIKEVFDSLSQQEKLYAHHLSRAAWQGSRIILRQVSPEANGIFDFLMSMYQACDGQWKDLIERCEIGAEELHAFLEYAALFLCNLGNYYGEGDQKFVPGVSEETLRKIANISPSTSQALEKVIGPMISELPHSIGFPSDTEQSSYYPGDEIISREEIAAVSEIMGKQLIEPENTRLRKIIENGQTIFELLQASSEKDKTAEPEYIMNSPEAVLRVVKGDHAEELAAICSSLSETIKYAADEKQATMLSYYIKSFQTGSLEAYRESQKIWVTDTDPVVESIFGFVEQYRDPFGVRSEWEGIVSIADAGETEKLKQCSERSTEFISRLPWAVEGQNSGKGPFEKSLFEAPAFTSSHALAFCCCFIYEAANLPNYNDIRETCGFKNLVYANRMSANNNPATPCYYVDPSEVHRFKECTHIVRFVSTAIHELLGHGTGKLMSETSPGTYNFDNSNPPINPLTNRPIESWYLPGQTFYSVFGKIATSAEECRANLVAYYLMDEKDLLSIFGYTDSSYVTADDLIYNTYLQIGVEGLQALEFYNIQTQAWGEAHKRGHFALLKWLLIDGGGVMSVDYDRDNKNLTVRVDRSKVLTHGKPSLGRFLCRLHIWRCVADAKSCADLYEPLTTVDGAYEEWRQVVCSKPTPRWKFVQANTVLEGQEVVVKVYEENNEGIIRSWAERGI
ncbi:hypothetical protein TWF481_006083 [Arthrobotrys musiformis]|uniref:Dipeptidyl peptidase 3 n=1 Tax=Arthrobotrys musiformis TaxID=47236 RepID=A0AAV9WLE1_9PEZI